MILSDNGNAGTIIVLILLISMVVLIVVGLILKRKRGSCSGCPHANICGNKANEEKKKEGEDK